MLVLLADSEAALLHLAELVEPAGRHRVVDVADVVVREDAVVVAVAADVAARTATRNGCR